MSAVEIPPPPGLVTPADAEKIRQAASTWNAVHARPIDSSLTFAAGHRPDLSHDALAQELNELAFDAHGRYWAERGRFLLWNGNHWALDEKLHAFTIVRRFLRHKADKVQTWAEGQAAMLKENEGAQVIGWAHRTGRELCSKATVASVFSMLTWNSARAVVADDLDRDDMLLGTPGGTVDLRTGELRKSVPADLITITTAVAPAPPGFVPTVWLRFLHEIMNGDLELVAFLQRLCGYALTGSVEEHVFAFLHGGGRNGKGVFLNTLLGVMGDYACKAPSNLFLESRNTGHESQTAGLIGKRFVFGAEITEGSFWDEAMLKNLTGGDVIRTHFMRQDYFDFMPKFTLCIAANTKPALRDTGQSIRDRILLVPFTVYIPPERRDGKLPEKLRAEWPAILRWMIDGCLQWQQQGLNPPARVSQASASYIDGEDLLGQFIRDHCAVRLGDPRCGVSKADFVNAYNGWRASEGLQLVPKIRVTKELESRGHCERKMRVGIMSSSCSPIWCYHGLEFARNA